jgi:DNA mismatch repair protein MutS
VAKSAKETPLMKQYNQIKGKYPDALLLFRVGDFYETFGEDAVKTASILGILLTKRGAGSTSETELAGFPHHALNTYLPKLVRAGCRVAICDQLEDPKLTKKIVKRGVTELITPGVALNDEVLDSKKNNYLAALYTGKKSSGIALLDISTGDFWVAQGQEEWMEQLLQNMAPSEVLVSKPNKKHFAARYGHQYNVFFLEDWAFAPDFTKEKLTRHFETHSLSGFGIADLEEAQRAAGAVLHYLSETQHNQLAHINSIRRVVQEDYVWMDRFTVRNLELFQPNSPGGVPLIEVLDNSQTAMGGRLMKQWLAFPLVDVNTIRFRHEVVGGFLAHPEIHEVVGELLQNTVDIERIMAQIATYKVSPRALVQLGVTLSIFPELNKNLQKATGTALQDYPQGFQPMDALCALLQNQLMPDAPVLLSKGNVIAQGVSAPLDELRELLESGQALLEAMAEKEREQTGITSLKIAFNNVFGYYIEVRNTHKDKVPENWIRKQTLVNAERYITEELKTYETKILGAEEKIKTLEQELYQQLLVGLQTHLSALKHNALHLAQLDCLWSFASTAKKYNYHCPEFEEGHQLQIKAGRHPVIEQQLPPENPYVPNAVFLDRTSQQLMMITGPNMSGKSALLRQTALMVLMAQMGSYVPADALKLGPVDKVFTRVGASDNISMGASTFMVEMNETASILNNISEGSLVLLDEIGRGTSTYDGISIAWAIAEYLHQHPARPKVLFATHYHELNAMSSSFERIKNFNVSIKELHNKVLFLRTLEEGGSAHSFGIHVAKMAGMPKYVLSTAQRKLEALEATHDRETRTAAVATTEDNLQLSFFNLDDPLLEAVRDELTDLDIDTLTPVEALMTLNALKRKLEDSKKGS